MIFEKKVEKIYRSALYTRTDDTGTAFYFSAEDFPGLIREPYPFRTPEGNTLQGYFYHYASPKPGRIVVFDHGMGGGHRSYMREIERLAKAGWLVFAYDHTGCMESEGESTNGFAQSLRDLDHALRTLKADERFADVRYSVVGHSWGGFSCLNIAALHPDVTHIVAISGFASVERIVKQNLRGLMSLYRGCALRWEREANPEHFRFDAAGSLKNTNAQVLIIHSDDDKIVDPKLNFEYLRDALKDRKNIRFLLVHGKNHNPNYTLDANEYKNGYFADLKKKRKRGELSTPAQKQAFLASYDWKRMTEQDPAVWNEILQTLES